jgi:3-dehydroquinate dehydratase-2
MRILVLHGPNLNLLGRREPHIYGKETLADVNARLEALARELGAELAITQSNHEGVLIDTLHANIDKADGAIINPAGITHYGVPLHDAIAAMPFPVIEVHLSNLAVREEWRHRSMISSVAVGTIQGLGWRSYTAALRAVIEIAREKDKR